MIFCVLIFCAPAEAHQGPPYPILVDQTAGPYRISVWADPDVGTGTFFVILEAPDGGTLPQEIQEEIDVTLSVQPRSERLAEAQYNATRDGARGVVQYKAEVAFDRQELWRVLVTVQSSQGKGEIIADVEVTPPGYGRWDLLIYLFPFLAVGGLWVRAVLRGRRRKRNQEGKSL